MTLIEKKYSATRGSNAETYQCFEATLELSGKRRYINIDIGHLNRWRSKTELADYLRWIADEVEKLPAEE